MSDTPETDAAWAAESGNRLSEIKAISRKLERERDEAREAFVIATDQMVVAQGKVREANKERDEAREALRALAPLTYHDCHFSKDMMGNCILCKREETK